MKTPVADRYHFPEGVCFQSLGDSGDGVLLSMQSGQLYRCNPTAAHFLSAVNRGQSYDAAIAEILAMFDVADETVTTDMDRLVSDLVADELLRVA